MSDKVFTVETTPAGAFNCSCCNAQNYFKMESPDTQLDTPELSDLYRKLHGRRMPEGSQAAWLMCPKRLVCSKCGAQHRTYQQEFLDDMEDS